MAKVADKIAKVQCKICMGYHRYRGSGGATVTRKRSSTGAPARDTSRYSTAPMKAAPQVEPDLTRPVRGYRASEPYDPGDRVQHPTFGLGVVEGSPGPGKMFVRFDSDVRVLAMAKPNTGLQRPTTRLVTEEAE